MSGELAFEIGGEGSHTDRAGRDLRRMSRGVPRVEKMGSGSRRRCTVCRGQFYIAGCCVNAGGGGVIGVVEFVAL